MTTVAEVVLQAFDAIERRDREGLLALYHPEIEFHEAPSLPYGGTLRGKDEVARDDGWERTWIPLQPTEAERSMDPRVIAANDREVVVLYRQRALSSTGARFDAPVLGLYEVREGKFGRAQMFHFDTLAVVQYLARTTP
jgi:uncharacterized protein